MTRAYFDASAIAKLIHEERESQALLDFLDDPIEATTSAISDVEVTRALRRHGIPADDIADALRGFIVVEVDAAILATAGAFDPPILRSLDAVHLATALAVGASGLQMVTYDDRLAEAARAAGLAVTQPGRVAANAP